MDGGYCWAGFPNGGGGSHFYVLIEGGCSTHTLTVQNNNNIIRINEGYKRSTTPVETT